MKIGIFDVFDSLSLWRVVDIKEETPSEARERESGEGAMEEN